MWEDNIKRDLKEICGLGQGSMMGSCKSKNEPACSIQGIPGGMRNTSGECSLC